MVRFITKEGFSTNEKDKYIETTYQKDGNIIKAHKINNDTGSVEISVSIMDVSDYTCVLKSGDTILDIHIPACGKMDYDDCVTSMDRALDFFESHFPEHTYKAYYLYSWLLCKELYEVLPDDSNIIKFANIFAKTYGGSGTHDLVYKWLFGFDKEKNYYKNHTPKTTLQKGATRLLDENRWFTESSGFKLIK